MRQQLSLPLSELTRSLVIHYSGVSHFSGTNNWEIYKRFVDGDEDIRGGLDQIASTANLMEEALQNQDLETAGALLAEEWKTRKALIAGLSTPEIDRIVSIATSSGAYGAKVCGAGGGGCVVMIVDPERRDEVIERLTEAPGFTVQAVPVPYGLETFTPEDSLTSRTQASWKIRPSGPEESIDELWIATDGPHAKRPYLVAEASVTFDASRRGAVHTQARRYVAPIRVEAERIEWALLRPFRDDDLELVSSPPIVSPDARNIEATMRVAREAVAELASQIADQEDLALFYNPSVNLLADPGEPRDAFIARCLEEASTQAQSEYERLEATFRLRIEQVRERFEREQNEAVEASEDSGSAPDRPASFPWGQVVHDLLSGREPSTPAPSSPMESDLIEKIHQHRKQWERDVEVFEERVRERARDVETIQITPSADEVEVDRHYVVWARGIESFPADES